MSEEQARAVVCFDNRVQVLAAAGSGKTSVMVARAAYAVSRGFVAPDRILMLAFNKAAATELQERVVARFATAVMAGVEYSVNASASGCPGPNAAAPERTTAAAPAAISILARGRAMIAGRADLMAFTLRPVRCRRSRCP